MLVSARILLAHTVAHCPDALLTDSIWYHPAFTQPENTFFAKPGIVLDSWIGEDKRVHLHVASIKRRPSQQSASSKVMNNVNFYVFPRVVTFVVIPNSVPGRAQPRIRSRNQSLRECTRYSRSALFACLNMIDWQTNSCRTSILSNSNSPSSLMSPILLRLPRYRGMRAEDGLTI